MRLISKAIERPATRHVNFVTTDVPLAIRRVGVVVTGRSKGSFRSDLPHHLVGIHIHQLEHAVARKRQLIALVPFGMSTELHPFQACSVSVNHALDIGILVSKLVTATASDDKDNAITVTIP